MKGKPWLAVGVAVVVLLAGAGPVLGASSLEAIKAKGEVVFGTDATYPPFEFVDKNGQVVGAEIDLAAEVAKRMGLKFKAVNIAWDGIFAALNGGKFDLIISSVSITPKRQEAYDFSLAYKDSAQTMVVRKGTQGIKAPGDLKGKTIGVQLGTTSEEEAKKVAGVKEVKSYSTFTEPFMELAFDRIEAIIVNLNVAQTFMARYPDKFELAGTPFLHREQAIVIRKGEKELKEAVDKALKSMFDDGWIKGWREKHMI
jgi:polar amino acid transport system substrate-binding protein